MNSRKLADLLGAATIVELQVRLDTSRAPRCCDGQVAQVLPGKGPHAGQLVCLKCGGHRGWLSKSTHAWLLDVVTKFGWPDKPVVIRDRADAVLPVQS